MAVWYSVYDSLEDSRDTFARFSAGAEDVGSVASDEVDNLVLDLLGVCAGHVDLVDDRNDLEVVVYGLVEI